MKDGLHGKHFADDDAVIVAIKKWPSVVDSNSYEMGMQAFVQQSRKCLQSGGEYVEE